MGAQATFAVLFLLTATANADITRMDNTEITRRSNAEVTRKGADPPGKVEFSNGNFIMHCPQDGTWSKKHADINHTSKTYTQTYSGKTKGLYHCKYGPKGKEEKYYFYVKGKGCARCFEVAPEILAGAIVVDVVGTACVMLMVFRCTKKKSSAASKAPARPGGRPPPAPSPHYEPLNLHTRSEGPYSTVSRTG